MRVIAGSLKGRRLASPRWAGLRPTSDRLRETLFNVLAGSVEGSRVLDAFAGTGALGIEALSRGAAHVTFVDRDPRAAALVGENLRRCGVADRYAIIRGSADSPRLPAGEFDLILVDPPYDVPDLPRYVTALASRLAPAGLLVVEHARRRGVPERLGPLVRTRQIIAGDSALAFYARGGPDDSGEGPTP